MLYRQLDKLNLLASHVGVGEITLAIYGEFYIGTNSSINRPVASPMDTSKVQRGPRPSNQ